MERSGHGFKIIKSGSAIPERPYYKSLDIEKKEIRLLHLAAGFQHSPICGYFSYVSLEEDPTPEYEAVSYAWGDTSLRGTMFLCDQLIDIPSSSEKVLRHFRLAQDERILWIDALCINQHDIEERYRQMTIVPDIFMNAKLSLVWRGESSKAEADAMDDFTETVTENIKELSDSYKQAMPAESTMAIDEPLGRLPAPVPQSSGTDGDYVDLESGPLQDFDFDSFLNTPAEEVLAFSRKFVSIPKSSKTFSRKRDLSMHKKIHNQPFKCIELSCKYSDSGFATEKELNRHMNAKHKNDLVYDQARQQSHSTTPRAAKVASPQPSSQERKKRNYMECARCRESHKKCEPAQRNWDIGRREKCDRCQRLGYLCGPPERAPKKNKKDAGLPSTPPSEEQDYIFPACTSDLPASYRADPIPYDHIMKWPETVDLPQAMTSTQEKSNTERAVEAASTKEEAVSEETQRLTITPNAEKVDATHASALVNHADTASTQQYVHTDRMPPQTDSGYASFDNDKAWHIACDLPELQALVLTDNADTRTAYSDETVEPSRRDHFVSKLVDRLICDSGVTTSKTNITSSICTDIAEWLADFAVRLVQKDGNQQLLTAARFIHKYRSKIAAAFEKAVQREVVTEEDDQSSCGSSDKMPLVDRMQMWYTSMHNNDEEVGPPQADDPAILVDEIEDDEVVDHQFDQYAGVITSNMAYDWLIQKLHAQQSYHTDQEAAVKNIRSVVLNAIPGVTAWHRARPPSPAQALFEVDWDPTALGKEANALTLDSGIGQFLTIVGRPSSCEALTCTEYIRRHWPQGGHVLVKLLDEAISGSITLPRAATLADCTTLTITSLRPLTIAVQGSRGAIAEVAEQLAWITAALRRPPENPASVWQCTPTIACNTCDDFFENPAGNPVHVDNLDSCGRTSLLSNSKADRTRSRENDACHRFSVHFSYELVGESPYSIGMCWLPILQGLSMVQGFPIRRRPVTQLGIELDLSTMACLVGTEYVQIYSENTYLKGYSAMLSATETIDDDILLWHLYANDDGEHISYNQDSKKKRVSVVLSELTRYRHIVGWCRKADSLTGSSRVRYNVETAAPRLQPVHSSSPLFGSIIKPGAFIDAANDVTPLPWHSSVHAGVKGLSKILRFLKDQFILLWDMLDGRGWLVNGVNVLSHLLRTSLAAEDGPASTFDVTCLVESNHACARKAAEAFLANDGNLKQKISASSFNGSDFELVGDRVTELWHVLEMAFAYQELVDPASYQSSMQGTPTLLEGYDFLNLSSLVKKASPSMAVLPACTESWVNLLKAWNTVTLFGEGFGELISPVEDSCCERWNQLPKDSFYIASSTADIMQLMKLKGNHRLKPPRLSCNPDILWYSLYGSSDHCGCQDTGMQWQRKSFVQTAWSLDSLPIIPNAFDLESYAEGAIVFGHNDDLGFYMGADGPVEGNPSRNVGDTPLTELFVDSGYGSSGRAAANSGSRASTIRQLSDISLSQRTGNTYGSTAVSHDARVQLGDSHQDFHYHYHNYSHTSFEGNPEAPLPVLDFPEIPDGLRLPALPTNRKRQSDANNTGYSGNQAMQRRRLT